MITTLFPTIILTTPTNNTATKFLPSLFPTIILTLTTTPPKPYFEFPPISTIAFLNDGKQPFGNFIDNNYVTMYASKPLPSDIVGNTSTDGITWNPSANNTDPPSHQIFTNKDLSYDCVDFPVFNDFNNTFNIAWIENNQIGRYNLKYTQGLIPNNTPPPTPSPSISSPLHEQPLYINPHYEVLQQSNITQNIPFNDIIITDIEGNTFNLNPQFRRRYGFELTLPKKIKSVLFSQVFRRKGNLKCLILTAPQAGTATTDFIPGSPVSNLQINVYYNQAHQLEQTCYTDQNGKFNVLVNPGQYFFEIIIDTPSIDFQQILL